MRSVNGLSLLNLFVPHPGSLPMGIGTEADCVGEVDDGEVEAASVGSAEVRDENTITLKLVVTNC